MQWGSFKCVPLFSSQDLWQISQVTQFSRISNVFGRVPLHLHPLKGKKAPSSRPLPGSSALQWVFSPSGTKSRPADGSLYPSCCGCQAVGLWRAAAAADSALSDWPPVRDRAVDHNGLRLCLFRHESTRWGGSQRHSRYWAQPSWPSVLLPTISLPPGTGHSRFLTLPTLLLSEARARSRAPTVHRRQLYTYSESWKWLRWEEEEDEELLFPQFSCKIHHLSYWENDMPLKSHKFRWVL